MVTVISTWYALTNCKHTAAMEEPDTVAVNPLWKPVPFTVICVCGVLATV